MGVSDGSCAFHLGEGFDEYREAFLGVVSAYGDICEFIERDSVSLAYCVTVDRG